ncbi:MAG TPA: hypothetical protein VFZ91_08205 [Allosphingosinicella sp.]
MAIINGTSGDDSLNGTPNDDTITGFEGNDSIRGLQGDDTIDGGDDHDFMRGNEGNDIILGGSGDDYLDGGEGDDLLDGGSGWDRVTYAPSATGGVYVDLNIQGVAQNTGQGNDTLIGIEHLSGTPFNDTLIGTDGDNWLWGGSDGLGNSGSDAIFANGGNDLVEVGAGNNIVDGGSGIDTLSLFGNATDIGPAGVTVFLNMDFSYQDTEQGMMILSGFENLSGSIYDDFLVGNGDANVLAGDQGNDELHGGLGSDTLYGDGRILVDSHGTGGSGPITTYPDVSLIDPLLVGGDDVLEGGEGDDQLFGGGGSDTAAYRAASGPVFVNLATGFASGADGVDTLSSIENVIGSVYDDALRGDSGDNVLDGFGGADNIRGEEGNDTIVGGTGHDFIRGGDGDDTISGGDDDDYMDGGLGDDAFDGGAGWDRVSYAVGALNGVSVSLAVVGSQSTGAGEDTLINIEHLSGTRFSDILTGNGGDNWIWGGSDNSGVTGDDIILAGLGNDLVWLGSGNHVANGDVGIDTLGTGNDADIAVTGVTLSLALQGAPQATGNGMWNFSGFENLSGSGYNDRLTGDSADNVLAGALGDDVLSGGAGTDTLYGDGAITVDTHGIGGSGPIVTYSDVTTLDPLAIAGDDVLEGGLGDDILDGGGGSDTASYAHATGAMEIDLGSGFVAGPDGSDTLISIENVTGSEHDDLIFGDGGPNTLAGLGGNDSLFGFGGDDTLDGGDDHDFMRGGLGADTLLGGNGDDFLNGQAGDDVMDGGAGFDRASFASGATAAVTVDLNIQGVAQDTGQGNDTLIGIEHASGTAFNDTLTGNGGDNWLWGIGGNDIISAGGGNDLVQVGNGNSTADGGLGTDTLGFPNGANITGGVTVSLLLQGAAQNTGQGMMTLSGFENLSGSIFDDSLTGDGNDNLLAGDVGNDSLSGGAGNDTLYGDGRVAPDTHGTGGSGPIVTDADVSLLPDDGPAGDDLLEGGDGDDTIHGGGGTDTASYASASGAVQIFLTAGGGGAEGAAGTDTLFSIENVTASAFDDFVNGNALDNVIDGGDGHDLLRGQAGNDTLLGGNGDDFLNGGLGDDVLTGGAGWDRAAYSTGATAGVTVDLNIVGVAQNVGVQGFDTLSGIEHVSGTRFDDVLTGDGGDNWLWGGSDGSGVTGNDVISAGGGNDLVQVGTGAHVLAGGLGNDTWSLYGNETDITAAGVTVSLALQGAAQDTEQGMMNASGFENLSGSIYDDALTGDNGANILLGDRGNDTLSGGDGDDTLYGDGRATVDDHGTGGSGPIVTIGDVSTAFAEVAGNDTLIGGKGNDTLVGGGGDDLLTGSQGEDTFVFGPASGDDHITDFAKKDVIAINGVAGVDDFSDLTIVNVGGSAVISWGTGDSITLDGYKASKLSAADFSFGATAPLTAFAAMDGGSHGHHGVEAPPADAWMP